MYVCMYIHHTLIAWVRFLWSRPQTTSHVVLVRPGGDRKIKIVRMQEPKRSRGHMLVQPGGDRRVKKIVREPKWSRSSPSVIVLEGEDGNKRTLHQKRVRQRRKESDRYSHDTSLTFWNSSDHRFAIFTTISRPQHLAPACYTWLLLAYFRIFLLRNAYSAHAYS